MITTAAATSPIRIGVVEPPPLLWEATEGTPLPAWIGCPSAAAIRATATAPAWARSVLVLPAGLGSAATAFWATAVSPWVPYPSYITTSSRCGPRNVISR